MSSPLFTRRHYTKIAAQIAAMPSFAPRLRTTREEMAGQLADMFKLDNSRFDREVFFKACGLL